MPGTQTALTRRRRLQTPPPEDTPDQPRGLGQGHYTDPIGTIQVLHSSSGIKEGHYPTLVVQYQYYTPLVV